MLNKNKFDFSKCSLLVFTCDRPKFIETFVDYWSQTKINIIIADGSSKKLMHRFSSNVEYYYLPGYSALSRINFLSKKLKSKYFMLCTDDDFVSISGLNKSLMFLEKNNSYIGCQGRYLAITFPVSSPILSPHSYSYADHKHIENNNIINRLIDINTYPVMHYCYAVLHCSVLETAKKIWKSTENNDDSPVMFETLMRIAVAFSGKFKTLNHFHCARRPSYPSQNPKKIIEEKKPIYNIVEKNLNQILNQKYKIAKENKIFGKLILDVYKNSCDMNLQYPITNLTKPKTLKKEFYYILKRKLKSAYVKLLPFSSFNVSSSFFDYDKEQTLKCKTEWENIKKYL